MEKISNINLTTTAARLFIYAVLATASVLAIYLDAGSLIDGRKFTENSYTEWMQIVFIFLTILIFLYVGKRFSVLRPVSYLFVGGFVVMLIREMDGYLDAIYHGAWLPFALVALVVTLSVAHRQRHQLVESVKLFLSTPAFGFFVAGGLSVFVFSRLFGNKRVWKAMFQVDSLDPFTASRWVKNAVEEGSELFGYCLIFCASIELLSYVHRQLDPGAGKITDDSCPENS